MSIVLDGTLGITSPAETVQGALTTTGNTILGDASTDTLNVGNGGLVKDASGNVGIGTASPSSYGSPLSVYAATNPTLSIVSGGANAYLRLFSTSDNNMYLTNTGGAMTIITANTEQMRIDSAGLLKFNSGYGSAATAYGCRAWVNFNGTGTPAIRASGGASSITDHGTGQYTVNFSITFPDTNYVATGTANDNGSTAEYNVLVSTAGTPATTSCRLITAKTSTNNLYDPLYVYMTFVR